MEKFSFFNDVDGDRVYYAEDFARHLSTYFTNGIFNNGCQVLANTNNMSVNVNTGSANINGYRYDNDSIKTLTIENADGILNRIDNIVIRWDLTNRTITTQIVKGTFAENPIAPDLIRTSTMYDLRIAKVSIPAGTTEITQDLVTDTRFITSDCGNVISTIQTPDTEQLFIQIQAIFDKKIKDMSFDFDTWFENIKDKLTTDQAGHLQSEIDKVTTDISNLKNDVEKIGEFEDLTTKDKTSLVNAINEVNKRGLFVNLTSSGGYEFASDGEQNMPIQIEYTNAENNEFSVEEKFLVIGKGINYIKANGQFYLYTGTVNVRNHFGVKKNGQIVSRTMKLKDSNYTTFDFTTSAIPVQEGDKISFYFEGKKGDIMNTSTHTNFYNVEVIE